MCQIRYFFEMWQGLQVVYQWISCISCGFRVKLDGSKMEKEEALVNLLRSYQSVLSIAIYWNELKFK